LSSGIDSASLISQLVTAEKAPANILLAEQNDLSSHKSIVDSLASSVASLGTLVGGMTLSSDLQFRTASSSDSHVTVTADGTAAAATHDVRVLQTAKGQVTSSRTFSSNTAGVLGSGSVDIQTGTASPITVSWDSTDTLDSIASKLNDANAGVSASVLYDGSSYRLMLTSKQTGTANAATFTDHGDGLAFSAASGVRVAAQDAQVSIDGVTVTRPTNVIDDALTGVTITANSAQAATDPDSSIAVSVDHDGAATALQKFVDSYNSIANALNTQLTYTGSDAASTTLFGDSTLIQLKQGLSNFITNQFSTGSLADLGLTIDKTGVLSLDQSKLDTALDGNQDAIADIFVRGGAADTLQGMTKGYTEAGDGILVTKSQGYTDQNKDLQDQIDQINDNATALQTRLQNQFTALEATMSSLNNQSTYITKLLES
jgi:flagellar hook-associated protein 2